MCQLKWCIRAPTKHAYWIEAKGYILLLSGAAQRGGSAVRDVCPPSSAAILSPFRGSGYYIAFLYLQFRIALPFT